MSFDYVQYKESQNLFVYILDEKEQIYRDLNNIEWSWTGRDGVMFSNQFFQESVQLIINAITLFEKGYFDSAIYSLRQSIEISTTSVYLSDNFDENRVLQINKWKSQDKFPQQYQMLQQLLNSRNVFAEIRLNLKDFFDDIELYKQKMNKYVHKQGFDKFYTYKPQCELLQEQRKIDFNIFLTKTISAVAVFRLIIDPLPILLLDESIYNRTGQFLTESYDNTFIEKYIGFENIEAYKKTNFYQAYYNSLMQGDEMIPCVRDFIKHDFIDRDKIGEILTQGHLLSKHELFALALVSYSEKITKIYCYRGFHWYLTSVKSLRTKLSYSSADFDIFISKEPIYNSPYDNVFLSSLILGGEEFYIEHNYLFDEEEINGLILIMNSTKI